MGQEISTDFGRIDFILQDYRKNLLVVELEAILNTRPKLDYCFNQILNYKKIKFSENSTYCILYAKETNKFFKDLIDDFGTFNDVMIRSYSLNLVKNLYTKTIERLSLSFGLALSKPKNNTICYLRWLNKITKPFYDFAKVLR